ncbi:MAG: hypothetical protein AB7L09_02480 [Nitrospira sp.]
METDDVEALHRELKKLRRLEKAIRAVVEDRSYGGGGLRHSDCCNTWHSWNAEPPCDCYIADIHSALDALKQSPLDDIVDALETE